MLVELIRALRRSWAAGAGVAAGFAGWGLGVDASLLNLPLVLFALLLVLFVGMDRLVPAASRTRAASLGALYFTVGLFGAAATEVVVSRLLQPSDWDFLGFWLHARSAANGLNFYDHQSAKTWLSPAGVGDTFRREILDVGFWYPPPSMFLFLPLGWLDRATALASWYAVHVAVLLACVALLGKMLSRRPSDITNATPRDFLTCLGLAAALLFAAPGTRSTLEFAQTTSAALLALLLSWRSRGGAWGGWWLAVGMFIKPPVAALVLLAMVRKRHRVLWGFLLATVALFAAAVLAFGFGTCLDYVVGAHRGTKPDWIYAEGTNQSLLGLVLRATHSECIGGACVTHPVYLVMAGVLTGLTLYFSVRLRNADDVWTAALLLLWALLVYPVSQVFYSVLLLPFLAELWNRREEIPVSRWAGIVVLPLAYALLAWKPVVAYLMLWLVFAGVGLLAQRGENRATS